MVISIDPPKASGAGFPVLVLNAAIERVCACCLHLVPFCAVVAGVAVVTFGHLVPMGPAIASRVKAKFIRDVTTFGLCAFVGIRWQGQVAVVTDAKKLLDLFRERLVGLREASIGFC